MSVKKMLLEAFRAHVSNEPAHWETCRKWLDEVEADAARWRHFKAHWGEEVFVDELNYDVDILDVEAWIDGKMREEREGGA